ncbi:pre-mRNA-splicing factor ATP-dependent RNA helicase [Salix suchowensis]|nr:pre-mRNA-splicing factor ATP-dependent RNA helicase [Salix suchowensis]
MLLIFVTLALSKQEREVVLAGKQKTYQLLDADDDHEYDGAGDIDNKSLIAYASDRHKKRLRKKIESEDEPSIAGWLGVFAVEGEATREEEERMGRDRRVWRLEKKKKGWGKKGWGWGWGG